MSRLAFRPPLPLKTSTRADPSTVRSGTTLQFGLVLNPTATSSLFSQTTKRYPIIWPAHFVSASDRKKPFGRPSAERSIRTSGVASGSIFVCPLEQPYSRPTTATTVAAAVRFLPDLLIPCTFHRHLPTRSVLQRVRVSQISGWERCGSERSTRSGATVCWGKPGAEGAEGNQRGNQGRETRGNQGKPGGNQGRTRHFLKTGDSPHVSSAHPQTDRPEQNSSPRHFPPFLEFAHWLTDETRCESA